MFKLVASVFSLIVLVGALGLSSSAQSTYTWATVPVSGPSPSPRVGHQMVYDSGRNKVILFGGQTTQGCCSGQHDLTGELLNDMWEWDGSTKTWSRVTPAGGSTPAARSFFGMAYDPLRRKVVIFGGKQDAPYWNTGGDTWEWDPATKLWTSFPAANTINYLGRRGLQMAFDPNTGQVILFGGIVYWGEFLSDTFAWDGSTWIVRSTTGPLGRQGHTMATDFARSKVVMVGGYYYYDDGSPFGYSETWEWDGLAWTQVANTGPQRRVGGAMSYDFTRGVSVLFGGTVRNPDYGPPTFNDTWEWNGSAWSSRPTQYTPPPRDSAMAFDGSRTILFGGRQNDGAILGDTLALLPSDSVPPSSCPPQLPGLISWWRGEGNTEDSIGTNDGAVQGNVSYTTGKIGQGFRFHDLQDWVSVNSQVYHMDGGTVSTWFNWDGNAPANWVSGVVLLGSWQGGNSSSPTVWIKSGTLRWDFSDSISGGTGATQIPVTPGRWYHVSVTYDSSYLTKLYLDGVLVATKQRADPGDFRDEFGIGLGPGVTAAGFSGLMDEVQVYDRPLTACEVGRLYNAANDLPCEICDSIAPATTASSDPVPDAAGWNNTDVSVALYSTDNAGGTGVQNVTYSTTGAQTTGLTTVSGSSANLAITAEGTTTISFFARDNAGNAEAVRNITVRIDKTAPIVSCGSSDSAWHSADVSIACNNSDATSGLAIAGDSSFSLSTSVAAGTETATAATGSRSVCDNAGNCTVAGPIGENRIDRKSPEITIVAPASGGYIFNQSIFVNYSCVDGGSLVASCVGTTANGGLLDTSSIGSKTFTVNSTDNVGNSTSTVVNYTVAYRVPTNKDECKDGGWQTLQRSNGTFFNNQGACVSYVNTGH